VLHISSADYAGSMEALEGTKLMGFTSARMVSITDGTISPAKNAMLSRATTTSTIATTRLLWADG
jgi:hypothetical protein